MLKPALALVSFPNREPLKGAIAARDAAQQTLTDARGLVARIESVIAASEDATRNAVEANSAAKVSLAAWARAGCDPQGVAEHEKLASAADEAKRVADRAQVAADAARKGLRLAQSVVERAQSALQSCEAKIKDEIGFVILAEAGPVLARLERCAAEYQAARIEITGLHEVLQSWSAEGARSVRAAYARASATVKTIPDYECNAAGTPVSAPPAEVLRLADAWRERAAQLRVNPDA
jgi:hypothetical protein